MQRKNRYTGISTPRVNAVGAGGSIGPPSDYKSKVNSRTD